MQIFEDKVRSWYCLIWIYEMVLSVTVTAFCLYILKVLSLLLSLLLSLYFLHKWACGWCEVAEGRSFVRGVPEADPGLPGCSLLQFVCRGLSVPWGSQAGLGSPSGSVFPEFVPPLCSSFAHRGAAEFQPHLLGALGQALSDIQQNSNCTFWVRHSGLLGKLSPEHGRFVY